MAEYPGRRVYPDSGPRRWEHSYISHGPSYPPPYYSSSSTLSSSSLTPSNTRESRPPAYHQYGTRDYSPPHYMSYEEHHHLSPFPSFANASATHYTRPANQWTEPYDPRPGPPLPAPFRAFNPPPPRPYAPPREPYRPDLREPIHPSAGITSNGIAHNQRWYYSPESYVRAEPAPTETRPTHHDSGWPIWDFNNGPPHPFGLAVEPSRPSHMQWSNDSPVADTARYSERAGSQEPPAAGILSHGRVRSLGEFDQVVSPRRPLELGSISERVSPSPLRRIQNVEPAGQHDIQLFPVPSPRYHTSEITTPTPSQLAVLSMNPEHDHPHDSASASASASPSPSAATILPASNPSSPSPSPSPSPSTLSSSSSSSATATPTPKRQRKPQRQRQRQLQPSTTPKQVPIPVTFEPIAAHTAKCDLCNGRNREGMARCKDCGWQCCAACAIKNGSSRRHVLAGGLYVHFDSSSSSPPAGGNGDKDGNEDDKRESESDGEEEEEDSESRNASVGGERPPLVGERSQLLNRRQTRSWTRRNAARAEDAAAAAAAAVAAVGGSTPGTGTRSTTRSRSEYETPARDDSSVQEGSRGTMSVTLSGGGGAGTGQRASSDVMDGARSLYDLSIRALCTQDG